MRRSAALSLPVLLALACQQGEGMGSTAKQLAAWEATEAHLEGEARELAPKLQQLAREPGNSAALEALDALEAARQELHKTRVTMAGDLKSPPKDLQAAEQLERTATERMAAAIQKLEKRIAVARTMLRAPPAPASDKKKEPEEASPASESPEQ